MKNNGNLIEDKLTLSTASIAPDLASAAEAYISPYFTGGYWGQCLELLQHLCQYSENIILVVGEPGIGKTTLKKAMLANTNFKYCVLRAETYFNIENLLYDIAKGFAVPTNNNFNLVNNIASLCGQDSKTWVLLIDNAHLFPTEILTTLISSLHATKIDKQFRIVLLGDLTLEEKLATAKSQAGIEENTHILELEPFDLSETEAFLLHQWRLVGNGNAFPFDKAIIKKIQQISAGNPKEIERLVKDYLAGITLTAKKAKINTRTKAKTRHKIKLSNKVTSFKRYCIILLIGSVLSGVVWLFKPVFTTPIDEKLVKIDMPIVSDSNFQGQEQTYYKESGKITIEEKKNNITQQPTSTITKEIADLSNSTNNSFKKVAETFNTDIANQSLVDNVSKEVTEVANTIIVEQNSPDSVAQEVAVTPNTITTNQDAVSDNTSKSVTDTSNTNIANQNPTDNVAQEAAKTSNAITTKSNSVDVVTQDVAKMAHSNNTKQKEEVLQTAEIKKQAKQNQEQGKRKNTEHNKTTEQQPVSAPKEHNLKEQTIRPKLVQTKPIKTVVKNNLAKQDKSPLINKRASVYNKYKSKILNLPGRNYTLQILGSSDLTSVERFITNNKLQTQAYYYGTYRNNKPWYVLIYGNYATRIQAKDAINKLPVPVRKLNPWVRDLAAIKKSLQTKN